MPDFTNVPSAFYSLENLFKQLPEQNLASLQNKTSEYNKTQIPDRKIDINHPEVGAAYRQAINIMKQRDGTNFEQDPFKYIGPDARFLFRPRGGEAGVNGSTDRDTKTLAELYNTGSDALGTMIHEAHHVDTNTSPTQQYFMGHKFPRSGRVLSNIGAYQKDSKEYQRVFTAGNANHSNEEQLANIRSALGQAKRGTTFEDLTGPMLDKVNYSGLQYTPVSGRPNVSFNRENASKVLEQDVFPRERWIEPRPPTTTEKLMDYLQKFK